MKKLVRSWACSKCGKAQRLTSVPNYTGPYHAMICNPCKEASNDSNRTLPSLNHDRGGSPG